MIRARQFKNVPKRMKSSLYTLLILFFVAPVFAQDSDTPNEEIRIDRNHSTLGFTIPIVSGISMVTGKFTDFSVDLVWDDEDPSKSSVFLEIQVASVTTRLSGRDGDITGERILDETGFPTMPLNSGTEDSWARSRPGPEQRQQLANW